MTFTQQGKLIKATHSPASMCVRKRGSQKTAVAETWPVPQDPARTNLARNQRGSNQHFFRPDPSPQHRHPLSTVIPSNQRESRSAGFGKPG